MNGGLQVQKRNNVKYKSLKRSSTCLYDDSKSKISKLNSMEIENSFHSQISKSNENYITESMTTSDSPFAESLNSNLCPIDDVLVYDYEPPIELPKKYEYKVTEIYQIGFQVGDTERIYLPNILDFQDVSYQYHSNIKLSEQTVNEIWNDMTPMILSDDYQKEYKDIEQQGMQRLENYLSDNLSSIISKSRLQEKQSMMNSYDRIVDLRKRMFKMLSKIFSNLKYSSKFNPLSHDIDRLIDHLIVVQSCCITNCRDEYVRLIHEIPDRDSLDPVVVLCKDLNLYFKELQQKCLKLIQILIPQLELPSEFDPHKDLNHLIHRISSVN